MATSSQPKVTPSAIRLAVARVRCRDLDVLPRHRSASGGPRSEEVGDDARRRPFPGRQSLLRPAAALPGVGARPVIRRGQPPAELAPLAHRGQHSLAGPTHLDRAGVAGLAVRVRVGDLRDRETFGVPVGRASATARRRSTTRSATAPSPGVFGSLAVAYCGSVVAGISSFLEDAGRVHGRTLALVGRFMIIGGSRTAPV